MRIVCISDTHTYHNYLSIPEGDMLIHAGDFTWLGRSQEIKRFNNWISKQPHKYKIVVAGNHDLMFEEDNKRARSLLNAPIYLQDQGIVIEGLKVYGTPWSPSFHREKWAFNADRGSEIHDHWLKIPRDTDILITHGPPYHILDKVKKIYMSEEDQDFAFRNDGHVGCQDLLHHVKMYEPKLHVFGHIHEGYGVIESTPTTFVNASIYNHYNRQELNEPIIVEIG